MTEERQNLRGFFETIGPPKLRLILEHYPNLLPTEYVRDAVAWLLEKEAEAAVAIERDRWSRVLTWTTIVVATVGMVGSVAAWIAAWPIAKEWIRYLAGKL